MHVYFAVAMHFSMVLYLHGVNISEVHRVLDRGSPSILDNLKMLFDVYKYTFFEVIPTLNIYKRAIPTPDPPLVSLTIQYMGRSRDGCSFLPCSIIFSMK